MLNYSYMEKLTFICERDGKIIDLLCKKGLSYNICQKSLRNKDIKVDQKRINKNILVVKGQEISIFYEEPIQSINKIYEDENLLIVDKPQGIEVEGESGLAKRFEALAVHRLDRNTTGLTILAKNQEAKDILDRAIKNRTITKKYIARIIGQTNFNGEYTAYLVKDSAKSLVKIYNSPVKNSVKIISIFKTIENKEDNSLVECTLVTGKTHQLRAHLAFLGHAIIGDGKYGKNSDNKKFGAKFQLLRCFYIKFNKLEGNLNYLNGKEINIDKNFNIKSKNLLT